MGWGCEDVLSLMGEKERKSGQREWWRRLKMKMKRGDGVIDGLVPPRAPVTGLIGAAKTGGGEASVTRRGPASQGQGAPHAECVAPSSSLGSFVLKEELEMSPVRVFFFFFLI